MRLPCAVAGILYGIKPAVTAIVVFAAYRIVSRALTNNVLRGMAVLAFIAIFMLGIPFPYIVLMAGIIGYIGSRFAPEYFKAGGIMAMEIKATGLHSLMMTRLSQSTLYLNGAGLSPSQLLGFLLAA